MDGDELSTGKETYHNIYSVIMHDSSLDITRDLKNDLMIKTTKILCLDLHHDEQY